MTSEVQANEALANEKLTMSTPAADWDQALARSIVAPFDPVAYAYAGAIVGPSEGVRHLQAQHAADRLRRDGASDEAAAAIAECIASAPPSPSPSPATLAAFVAADGTVVHRQLLVDADIADDVGWTSPASVTPLLAWAQDRPPYLLVVTDRSGADVTASPGAGQPERTVTVPDDEIARKRGPGGWSQPSYQHRIEDSWRHNATRIAEAVIDAGTTVSAHLLVLSGDVRAVQLLAARLPHDPALPVRHITGSRAADGSQRSRPERLEHVLREAAAECTADLLDGLRENSGPRGLAVVGVDDTLDALARGQVETLLVQTRGADTRTAWFGAGATEVYPDHDAATRTGKHVRRGRLIDVAVRSALLSGAHVHVVPEDFPGGPIEGIGGRCRFRAT